MSEPGGTERDVLLWRDGTPLCRGNFLRDAARIAAQIPPAAHLLNLCEQREAFLLADRVAVMRAGRLEQVGTPQDLRQRPATPYVRRLLETAGV